MKPLLERLTEALTREHYRRAEEKIEASPEEHSAAMAKVVLKELTASSGDLITRIAGIVVYHRYQGLCPLDGPCDTCDCFDPKHTYERRIAEAILAELAPDIEPEAGLLRAERDTAERELEKVKIELAQTQATLEQYRTHTCGCDGDPIECGYEAALGEAEEKIRQLESEVELLRSPGKDGRHTNACEWNTTSGAYCTCASIADLDAARDDLQAMGEKISALEAELEQMKPTTLVAAGQTWERYRDHGPGCWHPVGKGYPCRSLQGLLDEHAIWTRLLASPKWHDMQSAIERVKELHSPEDRGAGPHCKGCGTHVTFTPFERCKTRAALRGSENPQEESDE